MGLVICVSKPEASKTSDVHDAISCICKDVIPKGNEVLFVPRPGRLMDVLRILKDNDIAYFFDDLDSEELG